MDYKVSVIVPVYNAEKYLHQCVNSLLEQSLDSIQIILVDDGSRDSSGKIIDSFAEKFDTIESYHKENGGSSSARNLGLTKVKGEYISFLDSDDWLESDTFEILYRVAKENGNVDIIQYRAFGESENSTYYVPRSGLYYYTELKDKIYPHLLPSFTEEGCPSYIRWSNCLRFYNRNLIEDNSIRYRKEIKRMEDYLFNFESTVAAQSYYYYGEKPLYHVVQNPLSKSRNYHPAMLESCNYSFSQIMNFLREHEENLERFSYYDSALYFADACISNEMSLNSLLSNVIRVRKVLKSPICVFLREKDSQIVEGWYGKVLQLIKKNSAFYFVYRYKLRAKLKRGYNLIKKQIKH